jgi:DNA-binding CsgD family transcriptional regulator
MKIAVEHVLLPGENRFSQLTIGNFGSLDRGMQMDESEELEDRKVENTDDLQYIYQQAQAFDSLKAIVLTASGEVQMMSAAAANLLDRYFDGDWLNPDRLPPPLASWVQQQLSLRQFEIVDANQLWQLEQNDRQLNIYLLCDFGVAQHLLICSEKSSGISPLAHFQSIGLSKREAEILALVAAGKNNIEISQQLDIGIKTVKKHLEHTFRKLKATNRNDAVSKALSRLDR